MNQDFEAAVSRALQELEWSVEDGSAICSKTYFVATGPKMAFAYLMDFGDAEDSVLLTGVYYSEGRNILEPCPVSIPKNATEAQIRGLVALFASRVDARVADSYAGRLMRKRKPT